MGKVYEGSEMARCGGRAVRWQSRWFFVLFEGGGCRVSPRFHLFVSGVNERNEGARCVQEILAWQQGWKDSHKI